MFDPLMYSVSSLEMSCSVAIGELTNLFPETSTVHNRKFDFIEMNVYISATIMSVKSVVL